MMSNAPAPFENQLIPAGQPANLPAGPYVAPWVDTGEGDGITVSGMLHSLRRRWLPALGLGILIATAIAALLWLLIPVEFEAISIVRVARDTAGVFGGRRGVYRENISDYMTYKETQATLMKSPFIITRALRDRQINQLPMVQVDGMGRKRRQPVAWLQGALRVDLAGESELVQVSLRGEQKDEVVKLLDAVVQAYMADVVDSERGEKVTMLDAFKNKYNSDMQAYKSKAAQLLSLAETVGSSDVDSARIRQQTELDQLRARKNELDVLMNQLNNVELMLTETSMKLQLGQYQPSSFAIEDGLMQDEEFRQTRMQVRGVEEQIKLASEKMRAGSPALAQINQELEYWRGRLEELRDELSPGVVDRLRRLEGATTEAAQREYYIHMAQSQMLRQKVEDARQAWSDQLEVVRKMGGYSSDLDTIGSELKTLQLQTQEMKMEIDALELDLQSAKRIRVMQHADIPDESNWLLKLAEVVGAWGVAFCGVVLGIAYWDYLGRRVNTSAELTSGTALRVIGALPALQHHGILPTIKRSGTQEMLNTAIDSIRTTLLFNRSREIQVILITSPGGQEGRSTVASQLAASLARSGRRTLLLDADFRNPQQHNVFGLSNQLGFSEALRQEATADETVVTTSVENLWLLPAGSYDQNSLRALSHPESKQVFEILRARFESIVIDAGPVMTGADALLVGQHVDAALISVRRDFSQLPKVNAALVRLEGVGIYVLGAVLNGETSEVRQGVLPPAKPAVETTPALTS